MINFGCTCRVPCSCNKPKKVTGLTPIITVEKRDCTVPSKTVTKTSNCKPVSCKFESGVVSISKMGDKAVVVLDDCTYLEAPLGNVDISALTSLKGNTVVTNLSFDVNNPNIVLVSKYNLETKTSSEERLPLPKDIFVDSGSSTDSELVLVHNTGYSFKINLESFKAGIVGDLKTFFDTFIRNLIQTGLTEIINKISLLENNLTAKEELHLKEVNLKGTNLEFVLNNSKALNVDLADLVGADKYVHTGSVINRDTLKLTFNDQSSIDIDLGSIATVTNSIYPTGGTLEENNLILSLSNNKSITVDMSSLVQDITDRVTQNIETTIINQAAERVINEVMKSGYRIVESTDTYTLSDTDLDGRTWIRFTGSGNQTLIIHKPSSEDFIGKTVLVKRGNGVAGSLLTISGSDESIKFTPEDISPVRRKGNLIGLVYLGKGLWDISGELP